MHELQTPKQYAAQAFLSAQGFTWIAHDLKAKAPVKVTPGTLASVNESLNLLGCRDLELTGCLKLQDINDLKSLTSLQTLNLKGCSNLISIEGIKDLTSLTYALFPDCVKLEDIGPLKGLGRLQEIDFSSCKNVKDFKILSGLKSLRFVHVGGLDPAQIKQIRDAAPQAQLMDAEGKTLAAPSGLNLRS